ncbi:GspH/FimT family pseudopilin [Thiovibrio sp. JS02]
MDCPENKSLPTRQAGYSLTEMVTVLAVIGVLAIIGVPQLRGAMRDAELRGEVRVLASSLQRARTEAVKRKKTAGVVFFTASGSTDFSATTAADLGGGYRVYVDDNGNGVWDSGEDLVISSVAGGVALYQSTFAAGGARYDSQGLANGAGSIRLANTTPVYYKISVSNTGNIRIEKSSDEGAI